jgi:hypothetical protein
MLKRFERLGFGASLGFLGIHCGGTTGSPEVTAVAPYGADAGDAGRTDTSAPDAGAPADAASVALDGGRPTPPPDAAGNASASGNADSSTGDATVPQLEPHCAPGKFVSIYDFAKDTGGVNASFACYGDDLAAAGTAGVFGQVTEARIVVKSVELEVPIRSGEPYAGSILVGYDGLPQSWYVEVWGTTAQCGVGAKADRLSQQVMVEGDHVYCFAVTPTRTYTHWLIVYRDSDGLDDAEPSFIGLGEAKFCPMGSCR